MVTAFAPVNLLVEGSIDDAVGRRLLAQAGLTCGNVYGRRGKGYLLQRLTKYNQAARFTPWLVLVDLDWDAKCAPPFAAGAVPRPAVGMRFRIAVRAVESWLLGDAERLAGFLSVPVSRIPRDPDHEPDPKRTIVNLARGSRNRAIREDIVPREGSGGCVGPGYSGRLIEFVMSTEIGWRPEAAARRSESLRRCLNALRSFGANSTE